MRVLVYGAGVLGCGLAHCLCASHEVKLSVLARGAWADTLERSGLRIRHTVQRKETADHPRVVRALAESDAYDVIFVVVQSSQVEGILPTLAANGSARLVFVGNQPDACGVEGRLARLTERPRECAFAFFSCGGRREDDRVVTAHLKDAMTVGGARGPLPAGFADVLARLLGGAGVRVQREDEMDGWLKWHAACILPMAFLAYARGCDLTCSTRADRRLYLDACAELAPLFVSHGIPIRPQGDEACFVGGPKRALMSAFYGVVFKTPLGRLCVTDHCLHAVDEMRFMADSLEHALGLDARPDAAPAYQAFKAMMPSWKALAADPRCGR